MWIELIWFIVRVDEMDVVDKGFMVVWMKMISLVEVVMRVIMVCVMESDEVVFGVMRTNWCFVLSPSNLH